MIGNALPWGSKGWVILEEGNLNPDTLDLDVTHYLVVHPSGSSVDGRYTLLEAQRFIQVAEANLSENE